MKVLLVDDHPMVLMVLRNSIHEFDPSINVLAVGQPEAAFDCLAQQPDIDLVLLDLLMGPAVDGLDVLDDLRLRYPGLPVVVVSAVDKLVDMVRVIDAGAMGFVPKGLSAFELQSALSLVLSGGVFIPPALLALAQSAQGNLAQAAAEADARILAQAEVTLAQSRAAQLARASVRAVDNSLGPAVLQPMTQAAAEPALPPPAHPPAHPPVEAPQGDWRHQAGMSADRLWMLSRGLTQRQCDVLTLLLKGLPNKLIARELNLSVDTVKDHVAAVLRTLGVTSRTQAVVAVGQRG